jgi:hypothetical protein
LGFHGFQETILTENTDEPVYNKFVEFLIVSSQPFRNQAGGVDGRVSFICFFTFTRFDWFLELFNLFSECSVLFKLP